MTRRTKTLLIAVPVLVVLVIGAFLIWFFFIKGEGEAALTESDLADRLSVTTTTSASTSGSDPPPASSVPTSAAPASPPSPAASNDVSGTWNVTAASELGYRVQEVLFGLDTTATGRTNQITGSMTIEGTTVSAASFTVDVASITSDEDRRDAQFRGRIMETEQFPEATFVLTTPIEFGSIPDPGVQVPLSASGDLTLHGVTQPVSFELTAEVAEGRIGVLGNIPVVFADYEIDNPSTAGITTQDNGELEFILVFAPG